jgi:hypothetical protein
MLCTLVVVHAQENRALDGSGNNTAYPEWGKAGTNLKYFTGYAYADGIQEPAGADRPNPRVISNAIFNQPEFIESARGISDFGWGFGQFIDHDITLVDDNQAELIPITVPECDEHFDPACEGDRQIAMKRSLSDPLTGTDEENPREVINEITAFVDGSAVYGVDEDRASWLRTYQDGKLKTSTGGLLPFNTTTGERDGPVDPLAPFMLLEGIPPARHFIAGDIRANEQPGLASFHTLFVREHNRLCDELKSSNPGWTDEELYQRARKIVGALIQVVLYEEFLPALGVEIEEYRGYNESMPPGIMNVFSAAAYRLGHTLVNDQIVRLTDEGETFEFGSIQIKDAFFQPSILLDEGGIDPIFIGMATQKQQQFDTEVVPTLRNFLFGPPGSGGLDLVSLNLNRGRERGLTDYNSIRQWFGLNKHESWQEITADTDLQDILQDTYGDIGNIDPWVGMLSEDIVPDKAIGELVHRILADQFTKLRDGDRFYYENDPAFSQAEVAALKSTRLSHILMRNTGITNIQENVFFAQPHILTSVEITPFDGIRNIDISAYPNPVNRYMRLEVRSRKDQVLSFAVSDVNGRVFLQQELNVAAGENSYEFDLDDRFTRGVYIITITDRQGSGSLKLVKQ